MDPPAPRFFGSTRHRTAHMLAASSGGLLALIGMAPLPVLASEVTDLFPALSLSGKSFAYNYPKALALSDRFEASALRLTSYDCRVRTYYKIAHLGPRAGGRDPQGHPDEVFDLRVAFHPTVIHVRLNHPRQGATVDYSAVSQVVEVKPFSFLPFHLALSPRSSLITSRFGHTIDHADFRSFYERVLRPACLTRSCLLMGEGTFEGFPVRVVNLAPDQLEARPVFGRMYMLLDRTTSLPRAVATIGPTGKFWERIDYGDCRFVF